MHSSSIPLIQEHVHRSFPHFASDNDRHGLLPHTESELSAYRSHTHHQTGTCTLLPHSPARVEWKQTNGTPNETYWMLHRVMCSILFDVHTDLCIYLTRQYNHSMTVHWGYWIAYKTCLTVYLEIFTKTYILRDIKIVKSYSQNFRFTCLYIVI